MEVKIDQFEKVECIYTDKDNNISTKMIPRHKVTDVAWMRKQNLIYQDATTPIEENQGDQNKSVQANGNEAQEIQQPNAINLELIAVSRDIDVVQFQDDNGNKLRLNFNGHGGVMGSTITHSRQSAPILPPPTEKPVISEAEQKQPSQPEAAKHPVKAKPKKKVIKTTKKRKVA